MDNEAKNNQNATLPRYKNGVTWVGWVAKDRGCNKPLACSLVSLRNKHHPGCSK